MYKIKERLAKEREFYNSNPHLHDLKIDLDVSEFVYPYKDAVTFEKKLYRRTEMFFFYNDEKIINYLSVLAAFILYWVGIILFAVGYSKGYSEASGLIITGWVLFGVGTVWVAFYFALLSWMYYYAYKNFIRNFLNTYLRKVKHDVKNEVLKSLSADSAVTKYYEHKEPLPEIRYWPHLFDHQQTVLRNQEVIEKVAFIEYCLNKAHHN